MRTWIVSYADGAFRASLDRLMQSALRAGIDERRPWDREALEQTPFYRTHKTVLDLPRGGGYWLWKPFIVNEALQEMDDGDLLVYSDAGIEISSELTPLFEICQRVGGILLFAGHYDDVGAPGPNLCGKWTKRECFVRMQCDEPRYHDAQMADASFMLVVKNERSTALFREWLAWCAQTDLLTDEPSACGAPELPMFIAHRHDQSILTLLAWREGIELFRHPSQHGNHLKLESVREPGEWTSHPYGSKGVYLNSPYGTLLNHHRGTLSNLHVEMRRTVQAPRERVFELWMRPDLLRQWVIAGNTAATAEAGVRVGGTYRVVWPAIGLVVTGTYQEVRRPSRLVYTCAARRVGARAASGKPAPARVSVTFEENERGTVVALNHAPCAVDREREHYARAWADFIGLLSAHVGMDRPAGLAARLESAEDPPPTGGAICKGVMTQGVR